MVYSLLSEYGYIQKNNGAYEPAIVVFKNDEAETNWLSFSEAERKAITQTVEEIKSMVSEAKEFAFKLTADSLPPLFKNDEKLCYFACSNSTMSRDIVFMQALKDGWIKYDKDTSKVVGAYLYI